jgi:predicted aspartyl protease
MTIIIPIKILPIDNDGYHLLAAIKINGKKANLIIDTGASRTVFDKTRIKDFVRTRSQKIKDKLSTGLGTNSMESHMIEINSLILGKLKMKHYSAVLLDLSHVNESYKMLELGEVEGVLGSDILHKYKAVINYEKAEMKLKMIK